MQIFKLLLAYVALTTAPGFIHAMDYQNPPIINAVSSHKHKDLEKVKR